MSELEGSTSLEIFPPLHFFSSCPFLPSPTQPPPSLFNPTSNFVLDGDAALLRKDSKVTNVINAYIQYRQLAWSVYGRKAVRERRACTKILSGMDVEENVNYKPEICSLDDDNRQQQDISNTSIFFQHSLVALQDAVSVARALKEEEATFWKAIDESIEYVVSEGKRWRSVSASPKTHSGLLDSMHEYPASDISPLASRPPLKGATTSSPSTTHSSTCSGKHVTSSTCGILLANNPIIGYISQGRHNETTTNPRQNWKGIYNTLNSSCSPCPTTSMSSTNSGAVPRKHSASALRPLYNWMLDHIPSIYTSSSAFPPPGSGPPPVTISFPPASSLTILSLSQASGLSPSQVSTFFENFRYKHLSPLLAGTRKPATFYEVVLSFKLGLSLSAWLPLRKERGKSNISLKRGRKRKEMAPRKRFKKSKTVKASEDLQPYRRSYRRRPRPCVVDEESAGKAGEEGGGTRDGATKKGKVEGTEEGLRERVIEAMEKIIGSRVR